MWDSFLIGFLGSLHCVGMCGPLILHFTPFQSGSFAFKAWLYHSGRISVYLLLGLIGGTVGTGLNMLGIQSYISFMMGCILIIILIFQLIKSHSSISQFSIFKRGYEYIYQIQKYIYQQPALKHTFFLGVANGILPCGLVYLAFAGSVTQNSLLHGTLYMLWFGLGTLPALLAISITESKLKQKLGHRLSWVSWSITLLSATILLYRGLFPPNLSILEANSNKIICTSLH